MLRVGESLTREEHINWGYPIPNSQLRKHDTRMPYTSYRLSQLHSGIYRHIHIRMQQQLMKIKVMNLKDSKEGYLRVWREEQEGTNDIILKIKIKIPPCSSNCLQTGTCCLRPFQPFLSLIHSYLVQNKPPLTPLQMSVLFSVNSFGTQQKALWRCSPQSKMTATAC